MSTEFQGKVVLITGAGSGIGLATTLKMASLGASISFCDINLPNLGSAAQALGATTPDRPPLWLAEEVDVGSATQVASFVATTMAKFGRIDYVFNCAGVNPTSIPLETTTDEYWDKLVNTNLKGVFLITRACVPFLQRGASIVNVSSICGLRGAAMQSVYCATKFGLIGLSKSLALELGPRGIRVNCVAPGYIDTPTNAGIVRGGDSIESMRMGNALERLGTPDEVADVVAWLFGEGARYVNGAVVEVDGALRLSKS
ncbi:short-chain dehydrogenase/reductase-like protein SDR [Dothidotthia symphoricarpi CBS 119687]|uniref:Short-chain dehydrogenase/reductase-like protein SDR n=1 Tax=Dothidotthia symphoricarpi CBS 119687 TaxID=1392245 RepID=A0A6A6ABS1_9PLEO|nr:short-chain dehydrogenase/reductase-like protein SDR [Dothidotthia symphoricarpi CBS 119687]KAF2128605.1 short-chain dehydrogenase/reductase-like protein SDR [Dothidotthia symphoricarpi CBS 119687]